MNMETRNLAAAKRKTGRNSCWNNQSKQNILSTESYSRNIFPFFKVSHGLHKSQFIKPIWLYLT